MSIFLSVTCCEVTSFKRLAASGCAEVYAGFGNGFHAAGGTGNKRAYLRRCLRLMRSVVSTYNKEVVQDLIDQGAIDQLIGLVFALFID